MIDRSFESTIVALPTGAVRVRSREVLLMLPMLMLPMPLLRAPLLRGAHCTLTL